MVYLINGKRNNKNYHYNSSSSLINDQASWMDSVFLFTMHKHATKNRSPQQQLAVRVRKRLVYLQPIQKWVASGSELLANTPRILLRHLSTSIIPGPR